jgi:hypothetical protein
MHVYVWARVSVGVMSFTDIQRYARFCGEHYLAVDTAWTNMLCDILYKCWNHLCIELGQKWVVNLSFVEVSPQRHQTIHHELWNRSHNWSPNLPKNVLGDDCGWFVQLNDLIGLLHRSYVCHLTSLTLRKYSSSELIGRGTKTQAYLSGD